MSLLTRAIEEPPPPERRPGLLLELGLAEVLTSGTAAAAHLRDAWESLEDPRMRAYAAGALARTLFFTAPARDAAAVARQAAAETPPELVDERQALRATEFAAARYGMGGEPSRGGPRRRKPIEGDGPGAKMLAAMVSFGLAMTGSSAERSVALAERALADDVLIERRPGPVPRPRADGAHAWPTARRRSPAGRSCSRSHTAAARCSACSSVNLWSGRTLLWRGELREAQERLEAANEQLRRMGAYALARDLRARVPRVQSGCGAATSPARGRRSRRDSRRTTAATATRNWCEPAPSCCWRRASSPPPWS